MWRIARFRNQQCPSPVLIGEVHVEQIRPLPLINLDALIFATSNRNRIIIGRIGMKLHNDGYLSRERRWLRRRVAVNHFRQGSEPMSNIRNLRALCGEDWFERGYSREFWRRDANDRFGHLRFREWMREQACRSEVAFTSAKSLATGVCGGSRPRASSIDIIPACLTIPISWFVMFPHLETCDSKTDGLPYMLC